MKDDEMTERSKPPFRADHVGSLIRPERLVAARLGHQAGQVHQDELLRIQHDCIREVVQMQQEIGLKVVTDGEFNRQSWQSDFLLKIANIARTESKIRVRFHSKTGVRDNAPPSLTVQGKLSRPQPIFVDDFKFLASIAKTTPKVTLPSPTVVHFRGGRNAIDRAAYPDMQQFYDDLARVYREEFTRADRRWLPLHSNG
jgi:5-methyltetrahydropteroyltriglutamate--homocysteine methyltransferase